MDLGLSAGEMWQSQSEGSRFSFATNGLHQQKLSLSVTVGFSV